MYAAARQDQKVQTLIFETRIIQARTYEMKENDQNRQDGGWVLASIIVNVIVYRNGRPCFGSVTIMIEYRYRLSTFSVVIVPKLFEFRYPTLCTAALILLRSTLQRYTCMEM